MEVHFFDWKKKEMKYLLAVKGFFNDAENEEVAFRLSECNN